MKIVVHKIKLVKGQEIEIIMEGSGNPADDHSIIGVKINDRDGKFLQGLGRTDGKPDIIEARWEA